ncbi:hypothetical protein BEV13_04265 [Rickettsiella grylli]|uniref:hypothetical protein n=1 Tax=Rickettsiella grylli TaxID=59196 RepID=UPI0008FD399E|nr:hypothetical protein [Rickettsiella grylli]OJA00191.1 hypothetical protein BEV13_04265 [Rickettsiella grylli]
MDNDYKKIISCTVGSDAYWMISPTGDGNCGLYAFACALIDAITTHKLSLDADCFNHFKTTLLNHLPHDKLKECLADPLSNFEQFKTFLLHRPESYTLKKLTQELSNALRQIGYDGYIELLKKEIKVDHLDVTDQTLNQDKMHIGFEILVPLATYFKINLGLLAYNANTQRYYWAHSPDYTQPLFLLINLKAHWNYLLPKKQTQGLTQFLPDPSISPSKHIHEISKKLIIKSTYHVTKLKWRIRNLKRPFRVHKAPHPETSQNLTAFYENLSLDHHLHIDESTITIDESMITIMETLHHLDSNTFTMLLNKQALKPIEKDLVTTPYVTHHPTDPLAIHLQNHAVLHFLKESYSLIFKEKSTRLSLFFNSHTTHSSTEKIPTTSKNCNQ